MARIYETKEDLEREQLSQVVDHQSHALEKSAWLTGAGLSSLLVGFIQKRPENIPQPPKGAGFFRRVWHDMRHEPFDFKFIGGVMAVLGAIGVYFEKKGLNHAQAELDKLGPQTVVLPPMESPHVDCEPCRMKAAMQPKSLMEYAEKPADGKQLG